MKALERLFRHSYTSGSLLASLGIAAGNTLEGLVATWLIDRFARGAACFERVEDVFRFAGFAAVATTVSAACATRASTSTW